MATATAPVSVLFSRARVSKRDEAVFITKLALAAALLSMGIWLELFGQRAGLVIGISILAAVYTHMVELQHQCLHHSAFVSARLNRLVGVPLGIPLLVSYSHYRVRHLQHHRFLGTPQDSEFFGFDTRQPITWRRLIRGAFDYWRLITLAAEILRCARGTWQYGIGQIAVRRRHDVIAEYRLIGGVICAAVLGSILGHNALILWLWAIPLAVAIPLHFLVELPEHILCDTDTNDVLLNTRSISGSRFSTWFTNGNNLHIEHHAAMTVPISSLRERHSEVRSSAKYVERSYPAFYRAIMREANRNSWHTI